MNLHAPIAPSSLATTTECPASVKLQASIPKLPSTEEELEGHAAHWVAMRYAAGYGHELPEGTKFSSQGREWTVDLDMRIGATMYANALGGPHADLRLEDPVTISRIHAQCWGTPDAWRYLPRYTFPTGLGLPEHPVNVVRAGEYKFGHRFVEVYGCHQLVAYFFGVVERLQLDLYDPHLWAEFIIVQPRNYHRDGPVRVWRVPALVLNALLLSMQRAAAEALESEHPTARTSIHCIDCDARHVCATLQRATYTYIDFSAAGETVEMPSEAIGQELNLVQEAIKRLEARKTGLEAQAEALLRSGQAVALYHMAPGQTRLMYKDDVNVDEVIGLGDLLGVDLRKAQTKKDLLVTPTQAIQLGVDESVMSSYAHRPPASYKLTRDDKLIARKVFSR